MNSATDKVEPKKELKHNRTGYVRGCRCAICVNGNKEYQRLYMKEWRNKKRSSLGESATESE